jgi:small GTP-binding protein
MDDNFTMFVRPTVGGDFGRREVKVDGSKIELMIWDTCGHERYRGITASHLIGAVGILLVVHLGRPDGEYLPDWFSWIRSVTDVVVVVVGTFSDEKNEDWAGEVMAFAKANGLKYIETSAKTGENVERAFTLLCGEILAVGIWPNCEGFSEDMDGGWRRLRK